MKVDIAIIGGGAGGLFSAIALAEQNKKVVVLERLDRVGKKLSVTGNGQGNITNQNLSIDNYYGGNKNFPKKALSNFNNEDLVLFMKKIGVLTSASKEGKVYPMSKQATSVLDLFRLKLESLNVKIKTGFYVKKVENKNGEFVLTDNNETIVAKKVIFACGGKAGKQFGTDGSSYKLLEGFGHKTTTLTPSLVQLKTDIVDIKGLHGLKAQVKLKAFDGERFIKETEGELLFTDYGVSGPAVFQISGHILKAKTPILKIDFLCDFDNFYATKILKEKMDNAPYLNNEDLFTGIINKQIGRAIVKKTGSKDISEIVKTAKDFSLTVKGSLGFDYAQVTKGGIDTFDVDENSMESKLVKGVYVIGEMLDVDGDSGGYNLQWAFSSAKLATDSILKELK